MKLTALSHLNNIQQPRYHKRSNKGTSYKKIMANNFRAANAAGRKDMHVIQRDVPASDHSDDSGLGYGDHHTSDQYVSPLPHPSVFKYASEKRIIEEPLPLPMANKRFRSEIKNQTEPYPFTVYHPIPLTTSPSVSGRLPVPPLARAPRKSVLVASKRIGNGYHGQLTNGNGALVAHSIGSVSHDGKVQLQIISQPEQQHRARYQTEGSRGAVKDRTGNGFPTVKISGYHHPATIQVYIGSDTDRSTPHMFYQACRVTGKNSTPCVEKDIGGTVFIEIDAQPAKEMIVTCDCVGILKERNVDVEHRFPQHSTTRNKKKSTRCRMVFRTTILNDDGSRETLQVVSQPIACTQPPGIPEICKKSLSSSSLTGGSELFILGKNFLKDSFVLFQTNDWEQRVLPDKEFLQQNHLVCTIPPYKCLENVCEAVHAKIYVVSGNRSSEPHDFTYVPNTFSVIQSTRRHSVITSPALSSDSGADFSSNNSDSINNGKRTRGVSISSSQVNDDQTANNQGVLMWQHGTDCAPNLGILGGTSDQLIENHLSSSPPEVESFVSNGPFNGSTFAVDRTLCSSVMVVDGSVAKVEPLDEISIVGDSSSSYSSMACPSDYFPTPKVEPSDGSPPSYHTGVISSDSAGGDATSPNSNSLHLLGDSSPSSMSSIILSSPSTSAVQPTAQDLSEFNQQRQSLLQDSVRQQMLDEISTEISNNLIAARKVKSYSFSKLLELKNQQLSAYPYHSSPDLHSISHRGSSNNNNNFSGMIPSYSATSVPYNPSVTDGNFVDSVVVTDNPISYGSLQNQQQQQAMLNVSASNGDIEMLSSASSGNIELLSSAAANGNIEMLSSEANGNIEMLSSAANGNIEMLSLASNGNISDMLSSAANANIEMLSSATNANIEMLSSATNANIEMLSSATNSNISDMLSSTSNGNIEMLSSASNGNIEMLSSASNGNIEMLSSATSAIPTASVTSANNFNSVLSISNMGGVSEVFQSPSQQQQSAMEYSNMLASNPNSVTKLDDFVNHTADTHLESQTNAGVLMPSTSAASALDLYVAATAGVLPPSAVVTAVSDSSGNAVSMETAASEVQNPLPEVIPSSSTKTGDGIFTQEISRMTEQDLLSYINPSCFDQAFRCKLDKYYI